MAESLGQLATEPRVGQLLREPGPPASADHGRSLACQDSAAPDEIHQWLAAVAVVVAEPELLALVHHAHHVHLVHPVHPEWPPVQRTI
eukprot:528360-Pyramimonas_sp.AAC.1